MKAKSDKPILPATLRDTEISKADVAAMLRVAQDKKAPAGRYKRKPGRAAVVKPANRAAGASPR